MIMALKPTEIFNKKVYTSELNIDTLEREGFNTFSQITTIHKEYNRGDLCCIEMSHVGDILVYTSFCVKDEKCVGTPRLIIDNEHIVFLGERKVIKDNDSSEIVYTHLFHFPLIPFMYSELKIALPIYDNTYVEFAEVTYMAIDGPLRKQFSENSFVFKSCRGDYLVKWHHINKIEKHNKTLHTESVTINGYPLETLENEVTDELLADYCVSM